MMKFRPLFQPKCGSLKFPHPVGVGFRGRLLGTAAAREVPSRRRVSKEERRSMVEEYVSKYRMENGGKFPTPSDTVKQVGGGYYYVRGILQELECNSKLATVETKDKVASQSDKLTSKKIDRVSGIAEVLNSEVVMDTNVSSNEYGISAENVAEATKDKVAEGDRSGIGELLNSEVVVDSNVSNEYGISADNVAEATKDKVAEGDRSGIGEVLKSEVLVDTNVSSEYGISADNMAEDTKDKVAEDDRSVEGYTARHEGVLEIREVFETEVLVDTSIVSESHRISTDDGTKCEDELHKHEDGRVMDMAVGSPCNEISNEAEYPTVGQMGKVDGTSGVKANTPMLNNVVSTTCEDSTVDPTDKSNGVGQEDTANQTFGVSRVFESNGLVGKGNGSNDNGIPDEKGSGSQGETSNNSSQTMIDTTKVNNGNEVSAKDETSLTGQTFKPGRISEENSGASREQETSLWGNLKSFASSIVSIWRK